MVAHVTVVDASIVVDWVAPGAGPASPAMATLSRLAQQKGKPWLAPRLLLEEVANALLTGLRLQPPSPSPGADRG
jgi:predicted nucleic acid-binding protein